MTLTDKSSPISSIPASGPPTHDGTPSKYSLSLKIQTMI
jgi:hypothetical protein